MHILITPSWYATPKDLIRGSFFREQAHALLRAGFRVSVIAPQQRSIRHWRPRSLLHKSGFQHWDDAGVPTYLHCGWGWFSKAPRLHHAIWLRSGWRLFDKYIRRYGQPDLLHAHGALNGGVLAAEISAEYGIPFVVTEHSSRFGRDLLGHCQQRSAQAVFRRAAARLAVSPELGRLLQSTYGSAVGPFEWVPNLVDPMFRPSDGDRPKSGGPLRLLSVAALNKNKGHSVLLNAVKEAITNRCDLQLRLVGEGLERRSIENQIQQLGLGERVKLLGQLNRSEVLREMQDCDALVVSSYYETFGVVLIEAHACGKPVISTACGGPNCVVNESNGFLVPPGDAVKMAEAFEVMCRGRQHFDARMIRENCLRRFGENTIASRLGEIYRQVVIGAERVSATRHAA